MPKQIVAVVTRLVGVEHDRHATLARRGQTSRTNIREAIIGQHGVGVRDQRAGVVRVWSAIALVAEIGDRALAAIVDR